MVKVTVIGARYPGLNDTFTFIRNLQMNPALKGSQQFARSSAQSIKKFPNSLSSTIRPLPESGVHATTNEYCLTVLKSQSLD